jgi:hypothetical protein
MRLRVLFHDNCFDGAASAAVFSRFYRERVRQDVELDYFGLHHKAGGAPIDPGVFGEGENAIVDFRYSQDPRLTWWFDHHISAFQQPGDEAHFRADTSGRKFHDPTRKSCTLYLADVAAERFGFDPKPLADLLHWAELIDGAQFSSPAMAVELKEPALRIMTVLEAAKDRATIENVIRDMQSLSLAEIAERPDVAGRSARSSRSTSATSSWSGRRPATRTASSPSTSRTRGSTASTSSSRTTCIRTPATPSGSVEVLSGPRSPSAPIPGNRSSGGTISPGSPSATAAAGTRWWPRSASRRRTFRARAPRRARSSPS